MNKALSLSIQLIKHIQDVEANYSRVQYYKKHFKIVEYLELFGIFTINTILTEMREDKISICHHTISKFCRYLMIDKYLSFIAIRTRFKNDAQLYWLNNVSAEEITRMIDYYKQINKPRKNSSSKNLSAPKKLYQKTLDAHTIQSLAHRDARKAMKSIKIKDQEEEEKQSAPGDEFSFTSDEYEQISETNPSAIQYFKKRLEDIKQRYYRDRIVMSDKAAIALYHKDKNQLFQDLIKDQE